MLNTNIFAKNAVNTGRQLEIDIAKTLAILAMIIVHLSEEYFPDKTTVFAPGLETWVYNIVEFLGGPLSAPVFMTAMGVGIAYSRNNSPQINVRRGGKLFWQAWVLNFLRFSLPCLLLYAFTRNATTLSRAWVEIYELDILHFAGLFFLFFGLMKYLNVRDGYIGLTALVFLVIGGAVDPWFSVPNETAWQALPGLFFYQNSDTSFPFFCWTAYPVAGYLFAHVLQRVEDKRRFYSLLLAASATLFVVYTLLLNACDYGVMDIYLDDDRYYQQDIIKFSWIILICFICFGTSYFASLLLRDGRLKSLIMYMSKNLNSIYIMQWILIGWNSIFLMRKIPVYGYEFALLVVGFCIASVALVYLKENRFFLRRRP